jgi:hypothetical protein
MGINGQSGTRRINRNLARGKYYTLEAGDNSASGNGPV